MSRPIIEVRNLSKRYRLGHLGFGSLRDEAAALPQRVRALFAKNQPASPSSANDHPRDFWALRDVSFDVQPGEVIGIIGRNGAGKSTLLKILSEITEPTSGEVHLRGRMASLLEVGTGFHPELSGRDNIFLNGAILGMRRAEIRAKFDEIVAFAEVDKFLDTPVKRYSSGMYVRLAFAVAAHLEPEILVIDEVLAVGDQAFQQKCLGKMNDVAHQEGRTVLFVSHNMAAVSRLCDRAVHLAGGRVAAVGPTHRVVADYLAESSRLRSQWIRPATTPGGRKVEFVSLKIATGPESANAVLPYPNPIAVDMECVTHETTAPWIIRCSVHDRFGNELFCSWDNEQPSARPLYPNNRLRVRCAFPGHLLRPGLYSITVSACELTGDSLGVTYEEHEHVLTFEVSPNGYSGQAQGGLLGPPVAWQHETLAVS
jgi:lipopolysaccharide transport system ATP-binding protein